MALIVGIDPGFGGAIAFLDPGSNSLRVEDMPVYKNAKGKTELNLFATAQLLDPNKDEWVPERCIAIIENVHAMTGQGVSSVFRFGQGFGALQMACTGHGYEIHYISPASWKKHFRLSKDKGISRSMATQRFPASADQFTRVKDDGRAEAALLALYGKEIIL